MHCWLHLHKSMDPTSQVNDGHSLPSSIGELFMCIPSLCHGSF